MVQIIRKWNGTEAKVMDLSCAVAAILYSIVSMKKQKYKKAASLPVQTKKSIDELMGAKYLRAYITTNGGTRFA